MAVLSIYCSRVLEAKIKQQFKVLCINYTKTIQQWIYEKRGVCKARMHTRNDQLIRPILLHEIHTSYTHGSDPACVEMLKGYNYVKQRSIDSESTRAILSILVEQMASSSIAMLPNLDSFKRTIRYYKKISQVSCENPNCTTEI